MIRILFICAPCLLIAATAAFGEATGKVYSERIAAVVNRDVILESDVQKFKLPALRQFMADIPVGVVPSGKWPTEREILDELVIYRLMEQDAVKRNVKIDDRQVEAAIGQMRERNKMSRELFMAQIAALGLTYEEFFEIFKRKLRIFQAISIELKEKLSASEQDYQEYFKKNRDQIESQWRELTTGAVPPSQPEEEARVAIPKDREVFEGGRLKLRQITLRIPKDAKPAQAMKVIGRKLHQIVDEIRTGADFASLAKKYSQDQLARSGGDLGWMNYKDMRPEMQKIVRTMKVGDPGNPLMAPQGVQLLFLERAEGRITKKEKIPEKERRQAEQQIEQQRKQMMEERKRAREREGQSGHSAAKRDAGTHDEPEDPDRPRPPGDKKAEEIKSIGILTPEEVKEYMQMREKVISIVQQKRLQERLKAYIDQLKQNANIEIKI